MSRNRERELMKEARKGHIGRITRLLSKGVDINARAKFGQTALMEAVFSCQTETMKFLLNRGADPRLVSNDGAGPLYFACVRGNLEMVDFLIEHGAHVNETRRTEFASGEVHFRTPLDVAIWRGERSIEERLLDAGALRRS